MRQGFDSTAIKSAMENVMGDKGGSRAPSHGDEMSFYMRCKSEIRTAL